MRACSIFSLISRIFLMASFSACHCIVSASVSLRSWTSSRSIFYSRSSDWASLSRRMPSRSISSWRIRRMRSSSGVGMLSISIRRRDAASSTRSIALSGRNRSRMYRLDNVAAATSAASLIRTPWWTSYRSLRPRRIETVSSTLGSATYTGWKRRSSAGSFSFPVLVERGRPDASEVAARERRFQHVGGVHGAFGRPRADQSVDLIDKEDDRAGALFDLAQHRLEPLFELPAELAAGDQGSHVQRDHASLLEPFRHVAVHNSLRQPLRNGRLAHAWLTDQARIVLGAPGEDLDHAADFFVPADDGIEFALAGKVGEITAVFREGLVFFLGLLVRDALGAPDCGQRGVEPIFRDALSLKHASGCTARVHDGQQQMLGAEIFVLEPFRLLLGGGKNILEAWGDAGYAGRARP